MALEKWYRLCAISNDWIRTLNEQEDFTEVEYFQHMKGFAEYQLDFLLKDQQKQDWQEFQTECRADEMAEGE